jgi:hypothetical protein
VLKWLAVFSLLPLMAACTPYQDPADLAVPDNGHPRLVMTRSDIEAIQGRLGQVPLFDASLAAAKAEVDAEMARGIETPVPQDYSGGYTHARHKKNYAIAQKAGALYQILGEQKYADYVRDMLLHYAGMYVDLPLHPKTRSYARGKIFWQCLNDANWLVFMSQAYDAIYDSLSDQQRDTLENKLFRPFADHISVASPQFFNRIHNHSTWGTAAVGMIGLVMNDEDLIQRALHGLDIDNFGTERDNDGGFIRQAGQKAGFLANLDNAFSPDGYYTEGPYYQRYAMYPYLVFAQSLRNTGYPEQAFERGDGVLLAAVETLAQLTDADGDFFPLNDAQKGMSLQANELVTAIDIAFQANGDARLLDIAQTQNRVLLDGAGFAVASAIAGGKARRFEKSSVAFTDGASGTEGGVAVLRSGDHPLELVFKYSAQGLSHGHYDKLALSLYEQGREVLQDYGMARFVNIGQKGGGNYLPENSTWAKQTIAHNALVVNQKSHFLGKYELGSQHHSELEFFDFANPDAQIARALETNAYPGTRMQRTVALLKLAGLPGPIALDVLQVKSSESNQYDLPFHFLGQVVDANVEFKSAAPLSALGQAHGYQHLYLEAQGRAEGDSTRMTWLNNGRFYTITAAVEAGDQLLLARLGANDPNFNLRREPTLIVRRPASGNALFVSAIEPHGGYSPVTERADQAVSGIRDLRVELHTEDYLAIRIATRSDEHAMLYLAQNAGANAQHQITVEGEPVRWTGPFHFSKSAAP